MIMQPTATEPPCEHGTLPLPPSERSLVVLERSDRGETALEPPIWTGREARCTLGWCRAPVSVRYHPRRPARKQGRALPRFPPQDGEGRAPFLRGAGDLAAPAATDAAPVAPAGLRLGLGLGVRVSWA